MPSIASSFLALLAATALSFAPQCGESARIHHLTPGAVRSRREAGVAVPFGSPASLLRQWARDDAAAATTAAAAAAAAPVVVATPGSLSAAAAVPRVRLSVCTSTGCPNSTCDELHSTVFELSANQTIISVTNSAGLMEGGAAFLGARAKWADGAANHSAVGAHALTISAYQVQCARILPSPSTSPSASASPTFNPKGPQLPTVPSFADAADAFIVYKDEDSGGYGWALFGDKGELVVQMWPLRWRYPGWAPGKDTVELNVGVAGALPAAPGAVSRFATGSGARFAGLAAAAAANDTIFFATLDDAVTDAEEVKKAIAQRVYTPQYNAFNGLLMFRDQAGSVDFGRSEVTSEEAAAIAAGLPGIASKSKVEVGTPTASPSPQPDGPGKGKKKLSTGAIVGIVIGSIAFIGIIAAVVVNRGSNARDNTPPDAYAPLNPDN
jgi:ribosomal protein L32